MDKQRVLIVFDYDLTLTEQTSQIPLLEEFMNEIKATYPTYRPIIGLSNDTGNQVPMFGEPIVTEKPEDYFQIVAEKQWMTQRGLQWMQQFLQDNNKVFQGKLTKEKLIQLGAKQKLAKGVPEGLWDLKLRWREQGVEVHYSIASIGATEIISSSGVSDVQNGEPLMDGVFAGEFQFDEQGNVIGIARAPTPFGKGQAIIEYAKGNANLLDTLWPRSQFRFDYKNIIVVGDGFSDISYFSFIRKRGGRAVAVYKEGDLQQFMKTYNEVGIRADLLAPRNFSQGSTTIEALDRIIREIVFRKCDFDPLTLHAHRRRRLKPDELEQFVRNHLRTCSECVPYHRLDLIPPA